jgi:hypothetical protein
MAIVTVVLPALHGSALVSLLWGVWQLVWQMPPFLLNWMVLAATVMAALTLFTIAATIGMQAQVTEIEVG